jgi:hypothetical protein
MTILEILGLIWLAIIIYCIFEAYFFSQVENDNIEEIQYTCCGVEIKDEVEDMGICPKCLEHIS